MGLVECACNFIKEHAESEPDEALRVLRSLPLSLLVAVVKQGFLVAGRAAAKGYGHEASGLFGASAQNTLFLLTCGSYAEDNVEANAIFCLPWKTLDSFQEKANLNILQFFS